MNRLLPGLFIILLIIPAMGLSGSVNKTPQSDYERYQDLIIDSIIIDNQNVFDNSDQYNNFLFKLANRFHFITKKSIIRKELLFKIGEPIDSLKVEETARNIRKNLMIYDVQIDITTTETNKAIVKIKTCDQWSSTGGISISREGNESEVRFGVLEKNLLGYNYLLLFDYVTQTDDYDYTKFIVSKKRWGKYSHQVTIEHNDNPKSKIRKIALVKPFYSLAQRHAYYIVPGLFSGRNDYYFDQFKLGESNFDVDELEAGYFYKKGDYTQAYTFEIHYRYNYETIGNLSILSDRPEDSSYVWSQLPSDSLNHEISTGLSYNKYNYYATKQLDAYNYTEDIDLGYRLSFLTGRSFNKKFNSYSYNFVKLSLNRNLLLSGNIVLFKTSFIYSFKGEKELSKTTLVKAAYYNHLSNKITFAAAGNYLSVKDNRLENRVTLGGVEDLRGFDKHFKSGSHKAVFHFELRYNSGLSFLSTILGAAIFTDIGQIWDKNEPINFYRPYKSFGAGLRVGFNRSTKKIIRADFAYTDQKVWEFSLGTGQYFKIF